MITEVVGLYDIVADGGEFYVVYQSPEDLMSVRRVARLEDIEALVTRQERQIPVYECDLEAMSPVSAQIEGAEPVGYWKIWGADIISLDFGHEDAAYLIGEEELCIASNELFSTIDSSVDGGFPGVPRGCLLKNPIRVNRSCPR